VGWGFRVRLVRCFLGLLTLGRPHPVLGRVLVGPPAYRPGREYEAHDLTATEVRFPCPAVVLPEGSAACGRVDYVS